jgi:hypothetical protein
LACGFHAWVKIIQKWIGASRDVIAGRVVVGRPDKSESTTDTVIASMIPGQSIIHDPLRDDFAVMDFYKLLFHQ